MSKKKVIITLLTTMIAIILSFILGKIAYWNKDRPTLYINNNNSLDLSSILEENSLTLNNMIKFI